MIDFWLLLIWGAALSNLICFMIWRNYIILDDGRFWLALFVIAGVMVVQSAIDALKIERYLKLLASSILEEAIKISFVLFILYRPKSTDFIKVGMYFGLVEFIIKSTIAYQVPEKILQITVLSIATASIINHCAFAVIF